MHLRRLLIVLGLLCVGVATTAEARIGGGQSYSGSQRQAPASAPSRPSSSRSSSSSSTTSAMPWMPSSSSSTTTSKTSSSPPASIPSNSSVGRGGNGAYMSNVMGDWYGAGVIFVMLAVVIGGIIHVSSRNADAGPIARYERQRASLPPVRVPKLPTSWGDRGRSIDPSFSEVLFLERAVLLVTRLFEAAPQKRELATLSPYIEPRVAKELLARFDDVVEVKGVTAGHVAIGLITTIDAQLIVRVRLQLNRHVRSQKGDDNTSFYSHEEWTFARPTRGAVVRDDDVIDRFGCPGCGSAVDTDTLGRCAHCQTALHAGGADWTVIRITVLEELNKGPLLTQNVQEMGTWDATVKDATVERDALTVLGDEERDRVERRARELFTNLQARWSRGDLDGLRPFETDALFQSHRFWLEEYKRQGLKNVIGHLVIDRVELCRVIRDGEHVVAMCRIAASCTDVIVNAWDIAVAGSATKQREFTEYWTFVKHHDAPGSASLTTCPGCGAPLSINQAGICASCQRKVTLGRFDWVVSRIEQDEEIAAG